MKMYKVTYSGYAHIMADNPQDAEENFDQDTAIYDEFSIDSIQEVDDFIVEERT